MQASIHERLLSALGAAIVVALFGYLLLLGLTVGTRLRGERAMTLLELQAPQPEQPRPRPPVARPRKASGRASPRNLRNKAAEIVAPPPLVVPTTAPPVISAVHAGAGTAPTAGASDRPGPGEGAGGQGSGTGSGGYGDGDGDVPPRLIRGRIKSSDLPRDLAENGIGGTVSVHYSVNVDGRAGNCTILASSGSAELDALTCQLIEQRFRFDPSRDRDGRPVRSAIEESHSWIIEREGGPPARDPNLARSRPSGG